MSISSLLDLVPTALGALALFAFIYLGLIVRERWQLLTKAAGVQSLELPGRRATATAPAEIDPNAMLATMATPLWSLHEGELDEPAR